MYEVTCFDLDGNTIDRFFQWDIDQKIVIHVKGCSENYLEIAPEIHFSNHKRKDALIVRSTVTNGETITADVPNILLQDACPLLVYVYLTNSQDVSSQKTILFTEIPIRERPKPSDYLYVENIKRITAEKIKDEIKASVESARSTAIQDINNTNASAKQSVNSTKSTFESTCTRLINEATTIKNNTQTTYNNTVTAANQTQTKIENDMRTLMLTKGMAIKSTDDGNGNVTSTIIIKQ